MSSGVAVVIGKRIRTSQTLPNREGLLRFDTRYALVSIQTLSKEPLLMSRVFSSKAAQPWAERIAQCGRPNLSAPKFRKSVGCSLTSFCQ